MNLQLVDIRGQTHTLNEFFPLVPNHFGCFAFYGWRSVDIKMRENENEFA